MTGPDRDANHAVEVAGAVARTAAADDEEAQGADASTQDLADVGAGGLQLGPEVAAVGIVELARHRQDGAGDHGMAVPVEHPDRFDLRQCLLRALEAEIKVGLGVADLVVGLTAQHFVDLGDRALDGLQRLQGMLLQDVEGALDALVGLTVDGRARFPCRPAEQHSRHEQAEHDDQTQVPERTSPDTEHGRDVRAVRAKRELLARPHLNPGAGTA